MRPSFATASCDSPADLWSDRAQAQRYDSADNRAFYAGLLARLLDGVSPNLRGRGLDLGCGSGFATDGLLRAFAQVSWHGLDLSAPMLARASGKPELAPIGFCQAAAERLPYTTAAFDVVVSNFSWHWFGQDAAAEVARVLRPGGHLLLCVPLRHFSPAAGNRWLAGRLLARRHNFRRLSSQGLRPSELPRLLPIPLRITRLQQVIVEEQFVDASSLLSTLRSRGALRAIFGADHEVGQEGLPEGPLAFEWPVGLLHAQSEG